MGMSVTALGLLEGAAEATAMIVKIFSGPVSDWLGKRRVQLLLGYGMAALSKPLFPLASTPALVATARIIDRVGKGIRGAPRDALVADVAPAEIRGACFGLRQSMDTIGAFAGPVVAIVLMLWFADHIRTVLWFAVLPAFIAVGLILFSIEEPARAGVARRFRSPLHWRELREFPGRYWFVVAIGATFTLTRFSEAFLVLRAQQTGLNIAWIPGVMVVMSPAYSLSAYPVGALSDRADRRILLACGLVLLIAADLVLGVSTSILTVLIGVALWGLHMSFTQGILAAMVAETAPQTLRGSAFGVFNLASSICMLLASVIAGWLWDRHGASTTFYVGAALAIVPLVMCSFAPSLAKQNH
ncbi:MFS transporter (plasmid) [Burkholderia thailandensis]|nr:MFS transporter [Burkholderia thailandensis]QRA15251.1 MFS transporter [Burkholderia thailandensis]